MRTNRGDRRDDARRRRVLRGGVIKEWDAAMGWVWTIPADPPRREIDLDGDAAGWESLREFLRRRR